MSVLAYLDNELAQRTLTSEVGSESAIIKTAVLWTMRNRAIDMQTSLYESGTLGLGFGIVGPRPYDSHQVPSDALRAAQQPLIDAVFSAPQSADITGGANDWFQPVEQDKFYVQGVAGYTRTAAQVIADLEANGAQPRGTFGTGSGAVMMFAKRLGRYVPRAGSGLLFLVLGLGVGYVATHR